MFSFSSRTKNICVLWCSLICKVGSTTSVIYLAILCNLSIFCGLSDADREEFFALSNCKGYTKPNISGIADTNAIGIDALPGYNGQCAGVCKVISRINHR